MMFNRSKARVALLVELQETLIRKVDELINLEQGFINRLDGFMVFEKKLEQDRLRFELLDAQEKKMTKDDMRF
jgi:hypothetical protein